jgi:hypothetical protein
MAKRVDPLKAKEAKQKKIAIGGFVILLAVLGIQGPKTLKMLKGPQAEAPAAIAPTTTPGAVPTPAPAASGGTTTAAPSGGAELTSVADSDAAPTIEPGQLATFERFSSKDPFAQQAETVPVVAPAPKPTDDATDGPAAEGGGKPTEGEPGEGGGATGGFTTDGGESDPAPEAPKLAEATSIAVNGAAEDVALEATFPKDEPTFVLVSVAKNGKSVEIGIAGGEYAGGGDTMTLGLGKKITLQNTADGSRYEVELLTIQGQPLPKKKR